MRRVYLGQCAQYCGTQHAKMLLRVTFSHVLTSIAGSRSNVNQQS